MVAAASRISNVIALHKRHDGLRLLHLLPSADRRTAGPAEGVFRHCEALAGRVAPELLTLDPPDAPFLKDAPVEVVPLGLSGDGRGGGAPAGRFGRAPQVEAWLRQNARNYDGVIVNGVWDSVAMEAGRVLPSLGVPYFVFTHGMLDPWLRRRHPLEHLRRQLSWWRGQGRLLGGARRVFFATEEERLLARNLFLGFSQYRGEVAGYGAANAAGDKAAQVAAFHAATPGLGRRPYLLFLDRLHPRKGCDLLVRAFAGIAAARPELDLVIAGPEPDGWGDRLRRIAAKAGIADRIHWPGMLSDGPKWGALRGAEAVVLMSRQESFGGVVAEALACGTPVLISDKVDIWREVDAAGAGLVATDDQAGADDLLECWIALDDRARDRLGAAARACFERHFDVAASADSLVKSIRAAL